MNAKELLFKSMDMVARQVEKAVEGLEESLWSERLTDFSMSPLEMIEHLAACSDMMVVEAEGGKKEWGEYQVDDKTPAGVMAAFAAEREKAKAVLSKSDDPKLLDMALNYITLHDAYHVGQLVSFRLSRQPDWNSYAIYE